MESIFLLPSPKCSLLVFRYMFLRSDKEEDAINDAFVPNEATAIVFHFKSQAFLIEKHKRALLPSFFLVTPTMKHLKVSINSPFDTMVILFNASIFSRLFNVVLNKSSKSNYKVIDLFNGYPIRDYLAELSSFEERVNFFESYLSKNIIPQNYQPDIIDQVYNKIMINGGTFGIREILKDFSINPRVFRRNFKKRIGLSAKNLSRIVRLNNVWDQLESKCSPDIQDLILNSGFYDQSHFINDFKNLTGESPLKFINKNLRNIKLLSGKP